MDSKKIAAAIKKGGGTATLTTVSGDTLTAYMSGQSLMLRDEKGGTATVTTANVYQKNGVIHVIDTIVMPNEVLAPSVANAYLVPARGRR